MARKRKLVESELPSEEQVEESTERLKGVDGEYLSGLMKEVRELYGAEDSALQRHRELVYRKKQTNIPEKYRHVPFDLRLSDLEDEVSRVTALITSQDPKLEVKALGREPSDKAVLNATQRQHHTMAALKYAGKYAEGTDTWRSIVRSVIQDGAAVSKMVPRLDMWQERYALHPDDFDDDDGYPEERGSKSRYGKYNDAVDGAKQEAGPPVAWVPVDLATWYPVWNDLKIQEHLEITKRPTHEVLKDYRLQFKPNRGNLRLAPKDELAIAAPPLTDVQKNKIPHELTVLEHWDEGCCTIGIEHGGDVTIVDQFEHGYGRPPIFFTAGRNFYRGSKRGMSAIDAQAPYVELLNYLYTIEVNVAIAGASPPIFHTTPEGAESYMGESGVEKAIEEPKGDVEKWSLGTLYHGRPGEKFEPMILPQISVDLKEIIQEVRQKQDKVSMPRASSAIQGDLEGAGFALNQILAEIRSEKSDIIEMLTNTLEEVTRFYWHLLRTKIGETVYCEGVDPQDKTGQGIAQIGLGPEDLRDPVKIEWTINWDQDAAQLVKVRLVSERLQNRTLNLDKAIEMLGDDPDEVRLGQLADWVRDQPEYKRMALAGLFQVIGRGDAVASAAQAIEGRLSGNPLQGPAGSPVNPGGGAGIGPDMGAAAASAGSQAPGLVPPGPVPGSTTVPSPAPPMGAATA